MSASATGSPAQRSALSPRLYRSSLIGLFLLTALAWFFSRSLLSTKFLPRWYCYVGNTRLLWTTVLADSLIGLSYLAISATLVWLVRRAGPDLPYRGFFWAFGLFIVSCGTTHFLEVVTVWEPVYWVSAAAKVITAVASIGTSAVLLFAASDIADFVRTAREAATRRGYERFRALFDSAPLGVFSFDPKGLITSWNPGAERIFGFSEADVIGRTSPVVPAELVAEHRRLLQRSLSGELITGYETIRVRADGARIPVSIFAAPLYDERGEFAGTMGIVENLSERKRLEDQQRRLESQVREAQKMEVLGRLAGGVAHDFNNMLMVLSSSSELLERALPANSPARTYVDQIQRTTLKAASITKQLLAFSRKQILEFRPMDLHAALSEAESMLPRLLGSDVELIFRHGASQSWILSDPTQIEQVVVNLAINSRDAMPEGGRLSISTQNAFRLPADVENGDSSIAEWVVLEVADTGSGMDEETRARIFDPFFTTKPQGKGTGLGLSTVYGIVHQSSGHIRVESAPGKGTRFELYFPAISPQSIEVPEPRIEAGPAVPSTENRATILLADDEPGLRQATAEILRQYGYNVLEAQSSTHALELAQKHHSSIDVLIADIIMPVMRGPELARRVSQFHPGIRVLFMSGYAEGFPETELPPNSAFLQKPFRFATLLEQLKMIRQKS